MGMEDRGVYALVSGGYTFGGPVRGRGGRGHGRVQRRGPYCDHCDMKGHTRDDCNKLKHCTHCNMQGHTKEIYFQLIGYPPDWKGKKRVNMAQASHRLQDEGMRDNCYPTPRCKHYVDPEVQVVEMDCSPLHTKSSTIKYCDAK
ncbi:hypothetical protein H5410_012836 [Solanum commersonii]|uniref:CCHC-type domain-containing protein n=1 Tax=Solanum commersonii TaxID=4109 RepID=A0A9J6ATS2_SOLCO|nr:hypothetical protein H5410_012836 [Solanum commersonii]